MKAIASIFLVFLLIFSGCTTLKDWSSLPPRIEIEFAESVITKEQGTYQIRSIKEIEDGKFENIEELHQAIKSIHIRGPRNAETPATIEVTRQSITASTGTPYVEKPPTLGEQAFGDFIKYLFWAAGACGVIAGLLFWSGRTRPAIMLGLGAGSLAVSGVILINFAAFVASIPWWGWILGLIIVLGLIFTGIGEWWGEKVKEKYADWT